MPTSLIAPIVGGAVSAGASKLIGGLLGGGGNPTDAIQNSKPINFNGGGLLSGTDSNGNLIVGDTAARRDLVGQIASTFGTQADQIAGLRAQVAPGFSAFTNARLSDLDNQARASIGNLRDNLAQRRVLGSSFGMDALARADKEFQQQRDSVIADSFLKELDASNQLLQQEFSTRRGQFQTGLDEMNLQANLAASLAGKASDIMSKNSQVEAILNAQAAAGAGKFAGQLAGPIGTAVGKGATDFFNGGGFSNFFGGGGTGAVAPFSAGGFD